MKWSISDIVSSDEYTGKIINEHLILNRIDDKIYYSISNKELYTIDFSSNKMVRVKRDILRKYKNPYLNLKNNTTVIFTLHKKEVYIDTEDYYKIKDRVISVFEYKYKNANRTDVMDCKDRRNIRELIFGGRYESINGDFCDMRKSNRYIVNTEKYVDLIDNDAAKLNVKNLDVKNDIRHIDGVVKYGGLEGSIYGGVQILNKIDDDNYYVRVSDNGKPYIAIESERNIIRGKIQARKIRELHNGNPYLEINDCTVILFTTQGHELLLDNDTFYKKVIGHIVYTRVHPGRLSKVDDKINLDRKLIMLSRFILDVEITRKCILIHKNGNYLDFRNGNLKVASRSDSVRKTIDNSGISKVKSKNRVKYITYIHANKKKIYLGTYATVEEAKRARKEAERKYWGINK